MADINFIFIFIFNLFNKHCIWWRIRVFLTQCFLFLSLSLSVRLSLSLCPSLSLSLCPSLSLSLSLSIRLSLSVCPASVRLSVYLSVCLYICLSVSLSCSSSSLLDTSGPSDGFVYRVLSVRLSLRYASGLSVRHAPKTAR